MKAIILAAGYGTRLHPLTKETPKQLLEVGDKKIIDHILDKLGEVKAVDKIYLVTNSFYYPRFVEWQKTSSYPIEIINDKSTTSEDRLGAVGDIQFVIKEKNINEDVLVWGGDTLFNFDLKKCMDFFKEKRSSVVAGKGVSDKSFLVKQFGVIETNEDLKVIGFEEKPSAPKSNIASACFYLFKREDFVHIDNCLKEGKADNSGYLIEYMNSRTPVHCFVFNEEWFDIGSHEILESARKYYAVK